MATPHSLVTDPFTNPFTCDITTIAASELWEKIRENAVGQAMTVNELIEHLTKARDAGRGENVVVLSKDAEGNGYSPVYRVDIEARYIAESTWCGSCPHPDDDDFNDGQPCVLIVPVN